MSNEYYEYSCIISRISKDRFNIVPFLSSELLARLSVRLAVKKKEKRKVTKRIKNKRIFIIYIRIRLCNVTRYVTHNVTNNVTF